MSNYETDVCVIAAGPAGLSAAISAAEGGAKVLILEKSNTTGGTGNMGMGPLAVGTKNARRDMVGLTVEQAFRKFMDYTHWRVDARLVREYLEKSASTIEWLEDMGVIFLGVRRYFPEAEATWHVVKPESGEPGPRAASAMYKKMTERANELEIPILFETPASEILMEDGKVVGVKANGKDGEVIVKCKAAVIATGGFGDNPQMIKDCIGLTWGKDMFNFRIPGVVGDGIKMAWAAGGAKTDMNIEVTYACPGVVDSDLTDTIWRQPAALVLNQKGERVLNEELLQNTTFTGNAILTQPGKVAYSIIDSSLLRHYARNGLDLISAVTGDQDLTNFKEDMQKMIADGEEDLIYAQSLEELAEKTGIDLEVLEEAIDDYNYGCEEKDDLFYKNKSFLVPLEGPEYFVAKFRPTGYGTLGGIKINYRTEVQDENDKSIEGLYAAGSDACTIFGDSYVFILPGNTMGFALNSGRIAGENAAEFVEEDE